MLPSKRRWGAAHSFNSPPPEWRVCVFRLADTLVLLLSGDRYIYSGAINCRKILHNGIQLYPGWRHLWGLQIRDQKMGMVTSGVGEYDLNCLRSVKLQVVGLNQQRNVLEFISALDEILQAGITIEVSSAYL